MYMNRPVHFEIQADNAERAKEFYEKALGWKIEKYMSKEDSGMMDYWMIMTGDSTPGINGGMYKRTEAEPLYTFDCTIDVPDIDKAIQAVKDAGGTITKEKTDMKDVGFFAGALDTEGNRFGLMQAHNSALIK